MSPLDLDGLQLDLARGAAWRNGRSVTLTDREVAILRWLYRHRSRPVSRPELLREIWKLPGNLRTRTVDMTISNLRRKIETESSSPRIVVTIKGRGYAWGVPD
ncbi:MAG: winged helix-turn-helix domain-containing protein [bacterium]